MNGLTDCTTYCRTSPHLKGSKGLMRSPSAHYKEPDSMLLKKSWSSHEGTQLSARWSRIPVPEGVRVRPRSHQGHSWCSNPYFTLGNPCMISKCYCQNLWKHHVVFLKCVCLLKSMFCLLLCEIVLCLWYWTNNCNYWVSSQNTNWGKLQQGNQCPSRMTFTFFKVIQCVSKTNIFCLDSFVPYM